MDQSVVKNGKGESDIFDLILILAKRMKSILKITFAITLATVLVSLIMPKKYEGTAKVFPSGPQSNNMMSMLANQVSSVMGSTGLGNLRTSSAQTASPDLFAEMLGSRTIADALIDRFQLKEFFNVETNEEARAKLARMVDIKSDFKIGIVTIRVEDTDAKRAANLANAFVEELQKLNRNFSSNDATRRRILYEEQLREAHRSLSMAEEKLKQFGQSTGAIKIDSQAAAVFDGIAFLRAQIAAREIRLKVLMTYATPQNREVKQAEQEIAGMKEQLKKLEAGGNEDYGNTNINTDKVPELSTEYWRRMREFKFAEILFGIVKNQYESAKQDEIDNGTVVQVIDYAVVAQRKCKPKRALMAVAALLVGFHLAVFWAFFAEYRSRLRQDAMYSEKLSKLDEYLAPFRWHRLIAFVRKILRRKAELSGE